MPKPYNSISAAEVGPKNTAAFFPNAIAKCMARLSLEMSPRHRPIMAAKIPSGNAVENGGCGSRLGRAVSGANPILIESCDPAVPNEDEPVGERLDGPAHADVRRTVTRG